MNWEAIGAAACATQLSAESVRAYGAWAQRKAATVNSLT